MYPDDFEPSTNVGAPIPNPLVPGTYLIGEVLVASLAPGSDQIVKVTWPSALVPPESVVVSGSTVHWHPCLLLEAAPHDGPPTVGGVAAPVQGDNNVAQRNITIVDAGDATADEFIGMVVGTRGRFGVATLVLDASALRGSFSLRLRFADDALTKQLIAGLRIVVRGGGRPGAGTRTEPCAVEIEQTTRIRMVCGDCETVVIAAPGTRIVTAGARPSAVT